MYIHCRLLAWMICTSNIVHIHTIVSQRCPWAEHLTSLPKTGVDTLLSVSAFNHKRAPMSCFQWFNALEQINTWNHHWLQSWVLTAHNTLNSCTQWAWGNLQCAPNYLRPSMQKCLVVTFGTVLQEVLISDMQSTVLLKLHTKLVPGWALIRVNFYPMWEIIK